MEVTINTGMKSYLAALARHLVAPLVPITPSDHTRRAQFMLTFFGLLAPLVILGEWMTSAISMKDGWRHHPSFVPLAIVFTVVMLVILIRTSYYRIAAGITIGVLVIAALLSIALDTPPVNFSSSSYLIMSMLLASVMFSVRGAALLGVSQNLALLLVGEVVVWLVLVVWVGVGGMRAGVIGWWDWLYGAVGVWGWVGWVWWQDVGGLV